ncbi:acrylate utilization transcriptional regulator AcuR [Gallaecimonas mangrovi]|uniref:acrylate utilization transcriptional regulator AcuR n=1 Tax=Gallaecimonas mangrovi TaxID=2291597 RepID=UPI000E201900|nr:TetR/AcrR family transcriptional regulator [Gallaecimonas mangrovi]
MENITPSKRRGRPPRQDRSPDDVKQLLLRKGLETFTSQGFSATGLDGILRAAKVPKGSFYYYFASKEAYGLAVLDHYDAFFCHLLAKSLNNSALPALARIHHFVEAAKAGMEKYQFQRGCLVGNLGQEVNLLPKAFRGRLEAVLQGWQHKMAATLAAAQGSGELAAGADCQQLANYFWIGWEGAVLRARLAESAAPLDTFIHGFLAGLPRP